MYQYPIIDNNGNFIKDNKDNKDIVDKKHTTTNYDREYNNLNKSIVSDKKYFRKLPTIKKKNILKF